MTLTLSGRGLLMTGLLLVAPACETAKPSPQPAGTASAPVAAAASSPRASSVAPAPSAPPTAAPVAKAARVPTALDEAGQRVARAYLSALGRGRKATAAKDFGAADAQFGKCLELVPKDPRALAERGYARLLADKLPEAKADLFAAKASAPNSALELQIVHNLMLVAKRSGDERAVRSWEAEKQRIKAARRMPNGTQCTSEFTSSDLAPELAESFDAALKLVLLAHARADEVGDKVVGFAEPGGAEDYEERLKAMAARHPFPDGAQVLWTSSSAGYRNHAVIAQGGKLYVYPNLSVGETPLCGFEGLAVVTIEGGGATPWRIQRKFVSLVRGYLCQGKDGTAASCGDSADPEGAQMMGFCSWTGTEIDVTVLDAKTFQGIRKLSASAQPSSGEMTDEPAHLLELEWQADHVMVEACGRRQRVAYVEP